VTLIDVYLFMLFAKWGYEGDCCGVLVHQPQEYLCSAV